MRPSGAGEKMRVTISKPETFDSMDYAVKLNGAKVAEFWMKEHALIFKNALIKKYGGNQ
jgi:hypothetical protein